MDRAPFARADNYQQTYLYLPALPNDPALCGVFRFRPMERRLPVIFNRPHANLAAPGLDTPSVKVNQVINTMEVRMTKIGWPVNAQITASLEFSVDNEVTWQPGGAVTDDGSRVKDAFIRSQFDPPLASGSFWKAHVTVNQTLDTGVTVTVT